MQFFPKLKKLEWLIILGLVILYFVITLPNLLRLPMFVDEALYLRWAQIAVGDANWRFISLTDGKQPLYIWIAGGFMKLFSDPLMAGRLASVTSGIFTMLGMVYAGWLIKDKKMGLIAGILTIFSPYLFFYNRFGVMEAMLTAFGIWSFNISILLAKSKRLDVAMILGFVLGFGMLVKSSAMFYFLFAPVAYILVGTRKDLLSKKTLQFGLLILVSWAIAELFYNVQRLSPWMHVITDKNAFFTVPYNEIFKEPMRLWNNTLDIFRWHFAYTSIPLSLAAIYGIYLLAKKDLKMFLVLIIWTAGSLGGTAAIARLYAPRYIAFATPFVLLFAAYAISIFKSSKNQLLSTSFLSIFPIIFILTLMLAPEKFKFPSIDEGYVNGWTAGYGVEEASAMMVQEAKNSPNKVYLYTEGTFGILPHGIELYIDGKTSNLFIEGLYPIMPQMVARQYILDRSKSNPTYMLINNTELQEIPPHLELVKKWDKAYDTSMRLYKVIPVP